MIHLIAQENDYQKVRLYITDLLNKNYVTNTPFVVKYIEENILDKPRYMADTIFYANTLNTYAISFLATDIHKSIALAQKGIDYIGNSNTPAVLEKLALLHTNLANARGELGHHFTRLKLFVDIHPIILKTNNPIIIRNDLDKALTHLYKGIFISDDFNWHPNFAGITETLIASTYAKQNNVDSVRKYILLADKIKRDELLIPYKARIKSLMALSLAYEGNFEEGRKLLDEAYKVAPEGKDSSEMM